MKDQAKTIVSSGAGYVQRWWSHKYKRPPTDPLFESRGVTEWVQEMYEDLYERKFDLEAQVNDEMTPMRERSSLMAQLRKINKMLDEDPDVSDDPLIDKWEQELAAGKIPDLDEQPGPEAE